MKRKIVALFLQFTIAMNTRNKKGDQQSEIIKALKLMASYSFWDRLLKLGPEPNFFIRTKFTLQPGLKKLVSGPSFSSLSQKL